MQKWPSRIGKYLCPNSACLCGTRSIGCQPILLVPQCWWWCTSTCRKHDKGWRPGERGMESRGDELQRAGAFEKGWVAVECCSDHGHRWLGVCQRCEHGGSRVCRVAWSSNPSQSHEGCESGGLLVCWKQCCSWRSGWNNLAVRFGQHSMLSLSRSGIVDGEENKAVLKSNEPPGWFHGSRWSKCLHWRWI